MSNKLNEDFSELDLLWNDIDKTLDKLNNKDKNGKWHPVYGNDVKAIWEDKTDTVQVGVTCRSYNIRRNKKQWEVEVYVDNKQIVNDDIVVEGDTLNEQIENLANLIKSMYINPIQGKPERKHEEKRIMRNTKRYNEALDENKLNKLFEYLRDLNKSNQLDEYCEYNKLVNVLEYTIENIEDKDYVSRKLKQVDYESIEELIHAIQTSIELHSDFLDEVYSKLDDLNDELR